MGITKRTGFILIGILLLFALGCSSEQQEITPAYEPRSFDEVQPENVDFNIVSAPNLPAFPDCLRRVQAAMPRQECNAMHRQERR